MEQFSAEYVVDMVGSFQSGLKDVRDAMDSGFEKLEQIRIGG